VSADRIVLPMKAIACLYVYVDVSGECRRVCINIYIYIYIYIHCDLMSIYIRQSIKVIWLPAGSIRCFDVLAIGYCYGDGR